MAVRRPRLISATVLLMTVTGVGWIIFGALRDSQTILIGVAALVFALGVWRGHPASRWGALALGTLALLPGIYGLWGTSVVLGDWLSCQAGTLGSSTASYPEGFCQTNDWIRSFGIGALLIGVGLVGVIALISLLRHDEHFQRSA